MVKSQPSSYLIDTGAVDLFVDPPDESIARFWSALGKMEHSVCQIVYWEFLRKYGPRQHDERRQRFLKAVNTGRLASLDFDRETSDVAVRIYQKVKTLISGQKRERRIRMNELQCDIIIASIAVRNHKTVITDDIVDWALLKEAIRAEGIGTLPILCKDDMRDPKKWRGKT